VASRGEAAGDAGVALKLFSNTFELRPLCSYLSRRAGGRSSDVASA
jgi:hypothetical protein